MRTCTRHKFEGLLLLLAAMLAGGPVSAQTTDFSGEWNTLNHEDSDERVPGPPLGYYLGLPLNEAGRWRAESNAESIWGLPEFQCRPHPAPYQWRAQGGVQFRKEIDPVSRELTAYHVQYQRSLDRPIYMDGRPHPSRFAAHSWSGFSTGRFIGNILEVKTTHLKESYFRRNGAPFSDKATMAEYVIRHGNYLTVMMVLEDPVYLSQPFVQTTNYQLNLHAQMQFYPCTIIDENSSTKNVPHYLPGQNPYLTEFADAYGIPQEAARGGAETMNPEYRLKIRRPSNLR
ncbi:MAG: hypothetical protein HYU27_05275 [Acidobacteria bacterium]|nr:hypothetical protein [Acidobacteriota bacterium]